MVLDRSQKTQKSSKEPVKSLLAEGIEVRFDHSVKIAHNKIIMIDGEQTITGSYNWTHSAEFKNAENLVFIGSQAITKKYTDYFEKRWVKLHIWGKCDMRKVSPRILKLAKV